MMTPRRDISVRSHRSRAFTLVEVILAISIAIGILVVALYFYSQATNLRAQLLEEADRISSIRLVMDRLTSELRHAFAQPQAGFHGDATSLSFVTTEPPSRAPVLGSGTPRTDLRLVSYGLSKVLDGTNEVATGLTRHEQPLVEQPATTSAFSPAPAPDATNAPARSLEPMTDSIRLLRIWYWDGYGWSSTWKSDQLPRGVEITLGAEPLPDDASTADYTGELYRRVIYLPTSREIDDTSDLFDPLETASVTAAPPP
jgi:type II secretory pathway pseudopilin PulG